MTYRDRVFTWWRILNPRSRICFSICWCKILILIQNNRLVILHIMNKLSYQQLILLFREISYYGQHIMHNLDCQLVARHYVKTTSTFFEDTSVDDTSCSGNADCRFYILTYHDQCKSIANIHDTSLCENDSRHLSEFFMWRIVMTASSLNCTYSINTFSVNIR